MNKFLTRLSRRERIYVLTAAAALLAVGIVYPVLRKAETYRKEKIEALEAARSLRASYRTMIRTADQIRAENSELKTVLGRTEGLLFERIGNDVMMEASVIKMLNQMAPDLGLDVSIARSSLRSLPGQLSFSVRGAGRYPEILNFFYQLETHRPLIVIDKFSMAAQDSRAAFQNSKLKQGRGSSPAASRLQKPTTSSVTPSEPKMRLQMDIHINCRTAGEAGK
jgi:hypothetical protein